MAWGNESNPTSVVCPGRCQTREGFKEGIRNAQVGLFREDKGQRTDASEHRPEQHDDEKPFAGFQFTLLTTVGPPQQRTDRQGNKKGLGKRPPRTIAIYQGY
ncbi:Uncharacterised protein [Klebsiella michiganensis]|nr:Uncharacterised protein [Klebsiella michiganensis]